jgi:hypothetical protein
MAWTVFTVRPFICSAFVAFVGRCRQSGLREAMAVSRRSFMGRLRAICASMLLFLNGIGSIESDRLFLGYKLGNLNSKLGDNKYTAAY